MDENWVLCAGANLPTALFYLCEKAQEKLSEKDSDYKKAVAEEVLSAIDDKLAHSKEDSPLCIDKVLGIDLDVKFKLELGTGQLTVDVASFDAKYGDGAGLDAVKEANGAVAQTHIGCRRKPIIPIPVKKTILVCLSLLASFVFAETEVVDGIEWTYHIENGAAILGTNGVNGATAISQTTVGRVVTPQQLGGYPVKGMVSFAFSRCPQLTSVVISEGITNISECAFYNSAKIESVSLPDSVTSIGRYAFSLTALQEIMLPPTVRSLSDGAFSGCTNLISADLTSAVTVIPLCAFMNCTQLKTVILPPRVEDIGHFAFACKKQSPPITNIRFPASLKSICETAFSQYNEGSVAYSYIVRGTSTFTPLFLGDCPTIYKPKTSYYEAYRDSYYDGAFGVWNSNIRPVYIVEGTTGWPEPNALYHYALVSRWEGAYLEIVAAKVSIAPDVSVSRQMRESVSLGCTNSTATIYYTLDGSEPTTNETDTCFVYREPFELDTDTTIKALAYVPSYKFTVVETKDLRFKARQPTIAVDGRQQFFLSNSLAEIACPEEPNAKIYYTLNGEEPTTESALFTEPFAISQTTTVKAIVIRENGVASDVETVQLERLWLTNETPMVEAASATFATAAQTVTLSCATDGAAIYYTIDGSEPSAANGRLYKGAFDVYQTTTVKAVAVKDDRKDSEVAVATFTKENALGPALNLLEMLPDNDKTHPWTVVTDITHDGVSAVKSGEISDDESTTMKVVIYGAGELSFWWRTSCEPSIDDEWYDYATFYDGSTAVAKLAGATDWQRIVRTVEGTGKHTFKWTYQKDGSGSTVPDGVWVDQVQWLPKTDDWYSDHTLTTETPVPYAWLDKFGLGRTTDFETAAKAKSGKVDGAGRALTVEEEYVAGTDPTNAASRIETRIEMRDGAPVVTWTPDLNEGGTKTLRTYRVWGKETLGAPEWEFPTNALHRFFRVSIEMP